MDVPISNELLHIISHHKLVTPNEIQAYLPVWTKKHHAFVEKISKDILDKQKLSVNDYVQTISSKGIPIDEIGLLILTRMYHLKLCMILKTHYWCALNSSDVASTKLLSFSMESCISVTPLAGQKNINLNSIIFDAENLWM